MSEAQPHGSLHLSRGGHARHDGHAAVEAPAHHLVRERVERQGKAPADHLVTHLVTHLGVEPASKQVGRQANRPVSRE